MNAGSVPSIGIYAWQDLPRDEQHALLRRPASQTDAALLTKVEEIVQRVRKGGDAALRELTAELDGVDVPQLELSAAEIDAALNSISASDLAAIDVAIANVRRFHQAQHPADVEVETMPGVLCQRISQPLDSVGLYVPAGSAPLPSAAVMLAVPAAIAGCPVRIMCSPPQRDGSVNAAIIAAAVRSGVRRIFRVGGAQAIAAMAFGTESVPRVTKLFGPGNAWVTAAKSCVARMQGGPAIDMPAGPSEVLVIADADANPEYVAADLLSQAEHGSDSQVMLLTTGRRLAEEVVAEVARQLQRLSRAEIAGEALHNSRILIVDSIATALDISNRYAPEHLILHTRHPRDDLAAIRNAGSVFLGPWAPESVGDYCSGTNHVLPTNGFARSSSGLSTDQFMRQMTVQELSEEGLRGIAPAVEALALLEGLDAHANAVRCRLAPPLARETAG